VAIAEAATLTTLFPIKMVVSNLCGIVLHAFDQLIGTVRVSLAMMPALESELMENKAVSADEKKPDNNKQYHIEVNQFA
jgi:hypothetical protein